jgi:heme/copper-type cytochrome/quinol oxidase subunit 1
VFPLLAGLYYWYPKVTGRLPSERLGRWNFWTMFVFFNVTFFPMHISGLLGMPRRVYTYPADLGWNGWNLISTVGAFGLGIGFSCSWPTSSGASSAARPPVTTRGAATRSSGRRARRPRTGSSRRCRS